MICNMIDMLRSTHRHAYSANFSSLLYKPTSRRFVCSRVGILQQTMKLFVTREPLEIVARFHIHLKFIVQSRIRLSPAIGIVIVTAKVLHVRSVLLTKAEITNQPDT